MKHLGVLIAGLLFGVGLTLSAMVNPAKVLNFLDIARSWDPTLIFVMGAGLLVTFVGYRIVLKWQAPLFASRFVLPSTARVDTPLVAGAALFGLGWGLTGFCPGPAVAALAFGQWQSYLFVASMAAGTVAMRFFISRASSLPAPTQQVEG